VEDNFAESLDGGFVDIRGHQTVAANTAPKLLLDTIYWAALVILEQSKKVLENKFYNEQYRV